MKHYKQGRKIKDINDLLQQKLVWWQNKVHNIEVVKSWQLRWILQQLDRFYTVERIGDNDNGKNNNT